MEYYSLNRYLREKYQQKVYKVALDGGMTCPNRDGTLDTRGCIFCSAKGSGDFAGARTVNITEQLQQGKQRLHDKNPSGTYIAYFQAFTNTYADVEVLRKLYYEAMNDKEVVIISIATRPDCLSEEILELLQECNTIKPVWVELGLQTIHEATAKYIRRGYELACFEEAVSKLRAIDIEVIVHVILGLPGETKEQMLETVAYVGSQAIQGIKLQLLHVLNGTDLEIAYRNREFSCMTLEEYTEILIESLRRIPKNMVIHRLTGDGPKEILVAPAWSKDKKRVLNYIRKQIENYPGEQGELC